jgi:hypothetical protein
VSGAPERERDVLPRLNRSSQRVVSVVPLLCLSVVSVGV